MSTCSRRFSGDKATSAYIGKLCGTGAAGPDTARSHGRPVQSQGDLALGILGHDRTKISRDHRRVVRDLVRRTRRRSNGRHPAPTGGRRPPSPTACRARPTPPLRHRCGSGAARRSSPAVSVGLSPAQGSSASSRSARVAMARAISRWRSCPTVRCWPGGRPDGRSPPASSARSWSRRTSRGARLAEQRADADVLEHAQVAERSRDLKRAGDAKLGDAVGWQAGDAIGPGTGSRPALIGR